MKDKNKIVIFDGPYKEQCYKFIQYKKSMGFKYSNGSELALKRLDDFFKQYNLTEIRLTKEMVENFISKKNNESNNSIYKRQHLIKEFAIFLKRNNFDNVYVFCDEYIDGSSHYVPYIYTHDEIKKIFNYMDNLKYCARSKNQHVIYPVLIRLLYSCGLRLNEAISLKIKNISLDEDVVSIINGKGNNSRIIPLSDSMHIVLQNYIKHMKLNEDDYVFPAPDGGKYEKSAISKRFKRILKELNINNRARLHDLRHTFAVYSLEKMIEEGQDIYCSLPILSKYLGHSKITSTEHYLRLTNENFKKITDVNILNELGGEIKSE